MRHARYLIVIVLMAAVVAHYGSGGQTSRWLVGVGHPQASADGRTSNGNDGRAPGALDVVLQNGFESLASTSEKAAAAIRKTNGLPPPPTSTATASGNRGVVTGFSPGNAEELVVRTIGTAHVSLRVAAYSFTSKPIAEALVAAKKRGVDVQVVVDKSQQGERYTSATFLANMGIPVRVDTRYATMHNKFIVVDGESVQTGSFNYTSSAAQRNAENVVVLSGMREIASNYAREWGRLWDESAPYRARY